MRVAVVAPGAMGAAVAHRLAARGAEVAVTLAGRSAASAARAAGLAAHASEPGLLGWAEVVLSILPPGEALAFARRAQPHLAPGAAFVDCNAVSPATVRAVAQALPRVAFCDVGIVGGPPAGTEAGPRFYASGAPAAGLGAALPGLDWRVLDGEVGAASALKMSYAGITKGLTALGSAMALGAARAGVAEALVAELAASQPELLRMFRANVPGMFGKAYRWVAEMEEIAAFLGDATGGIYGGAAALYAAVAADVAAPDAAGPVAVLRRVY